MHPTNLLQAGNGWYMVVATSSGQPKSMLDDLTEDELTSLMSWSEQQPRNPGGAIDMMAWPGWKGVMARRVKDRFGADMKQSAT
jgi:hypothetical protein